MHRQKITAAALASSLAVAGFWAPASWLAPAVSTLSGGRVSLYEVDGRIGGPLHVGRLELDLGGARLDARGLRVDWSPAALLTGKLILRSVEAKQAELRPAPGRAGLSVPLSRKVLVESLDVAELRVLQPDGVATLRAAHASIGADDSGQPALALMARSWRARALAAPAAGACGADARSFGRGLEDTASTLPRGLSLSLSAAEVDISGLRPGSEVSRLRVSLDAVADGRGGLAGRIVVVNPNPGSLDRGLIPLARAEAHFRLAGQSWFLDTLDADLAGAGRVSGSGSLGAGQGRWQLDLHHLDLHGLHSGLPSTALEGTARVDTGAEGEVFSVQARQQDLGVEAEFSRSGQHITARRLRLAAYGAVLEAAGEADLAETLPFRMEGRLAGLDPARLGALPPGSLGADFQISGQVQPDLEVRVAFSMADSVILDQPIAGTGELKLSAGRLAAVRVQLERGTNTLSAQGSLGAAGDRLEWKLDAHDLAAGGIAGRGSVIGSGSLSGAWSALSAAFKVSAQAVAWEQFHLAALELDGVLDRAGEGPSHIRLSITDIQYGALAADRLMLEASGTRSGHSVRAEGKLLDSEIRGSLEGQWMSAQDWRARVTSLESHGAIELRLLEPALVVRSSDGFATENVHARVFGGQLEIAHLEAADGILASRGTLSGVRVASALRRHLAVRGDLSVSGGWDVRLGEHAEGQFAFRRDDGDLLLAGDTRLPMGFERFSVEGRIESGVLRGTLDLEARHVGEASGSLRAGLVRREGRWMLARDSALELDAVAKLNSLKWFPSLIEQYGEASGSGSIRVSGRGTVGTPVLNGEASFDNLGIIAPDFGLDLHDGRLRAVFAEDKLRLTEFVVRGGKGEARATGSMDFGSPGFPLKLDAQADRLTLVSRPDRELVGSGKLQLTMVPDTLELRGDIRVDRGFVELPETSEVEFSKDVIVIGRHEADAHARRMRSIVDLRLDLGDRFRVSGSGIDARVTGKLQLRDQGKGPLEAFGTLRLASGSVEAFGQQLALARGTAAFSGPLQSPELDIVAIREDTPDRVGIQIVGNASRPTVRLVADAPMTDSQKLSWITLGGAAEDASTSESSGLQAATSAFLAYGTGATTGGVGRAFGLDQLSVGNRFEGGTALTVGKRLSDRVFIAYEQSLTEAENLLKIQYELSRRWSVRLRAGYDDSADLFYRLSFD